MDEELRQYLEAMEARIIARLNSLGERLGDRVTNAEDDIGTLYSALTVGRQRWIDLDRRVRKIEGDDQ